MKYDYLIVGSGLFGSTFARQVTDAGKKCLIIESRKHIGGNVYSENREGIDVHMYGPHIFHTNDSRIWQFVNRFASFNNFVLSPKVYHNGRMYSLPFNMNTFYEIWGCTSPSQAEKIIESQKFTGTPTNLEEQALSLVGKDVYELLIRDYTTKQWKKHPKDLPAFIIKRLPVRFTYNNNYFDDFYQGIPIEGYTKMIHNMIDDIQVSLDTNYFENRSYWNSIADKIVYTGKIDEYFDYKYGELEYRTLDFQHLTLDMENYQGNSIINYPELTVPWTRIIEHKHFTGVKSKKTVITKEIPTEYSRDKVPYYPINDDRNNRIYRKYRDHADTIPSVIFGGRLSEYKYYDMHQVIASALQCAKSELHK